MKEAQKTNGNQLSPSTSVNPHGVMAEKTLAAPLASGIIGTIATSGKQTGGKRPIGGEQVAATGPASLSAEEKRKAGLDRRMRLQQELDSYEGMYLTTARAEYSEIEKAARFVEERLFDEPFHRMKVQLVGEMAADGRATLDGLRITLLDELPSGKRHAPTVHELVHAKDNWEGSSLQKQSGEHKIDKELWKHIKEGRAQFSEYIYKNSKSTHVEIAKRKILGLKIAGVAGGILAAGAAIAQIASCGFASWGLTISSMPLWILPVRKIMDIERKIDTYRRYYDFSHKLHEIGKMLGDTQADQIEVFKMCTKKIPLTWDDMGNLREFYKEEIEEIQKRKLQAPAVLLS